jgi:hypothetical protein
LPDWYSEYEWPVEPVECGEVDIVEDPDRLLLLSFSRAGVRHGICVSLNEAECGEATAIMVIDDSLPLDAGLPAVTGEFLEPGTRYSYTPLDPAEARYRIEAALGRRADHDLDADPQELVEEFNAYEQGDDDVPEYLAMMPLLRNRLSLLPAPDRPLPAHPDVHLGQSQVERLILQATDALNRGGAIFSDFGYALPLTGLPPRRRAADGPAPVYRLRIDLKYMKPPIWRRLEVPGDLSLDELHQVIQIAFDWQDEHLHAFRTPYGPFGNGNSRFTEYHDPASATLEQLLRAEGDTLEYEYDFGDSWRHLIKLEKKLPGVPGLIPRCTGGRRAAPEEDSEDPWGYLDGAPDTLDQVHINTLLDSRFG